MLSRRTFIMSLTLASMGFTLPSLAEDEPGIKVRQTVEAIDRYQKWVARGDYDRVQRSWLEVSKLWQSLDYVEQQSVEKLRPGPADGWRVERTTATDFQTRRAIRKTPKVQKKGATFAAPFITTLNNQCLYYRRRCSDSNPIRGLLC